MIWSWRRSLDRYVAPLCHAALDFVYPPECLMCGREVECGRVSFCDSCFDTLRPRISGECPRCGAPVGEYVDLSDGCGQCRRESFAFDRVIRLGVYDGDMRLACLRAKASGGSNISRGLARTLVREKRNLFDELKPDFIVPVPEHWTRRFLHSHYAAEAISYEISRILNRPLCRNVLFKSRRTPKQATSSTVQRRQQQNGSFGVSTRTNLTDKTIVLVDDILTTGATASAAARALKNSGAGRVIATVIAVSPLKK